MPELIHILHPESRIVRDGHLLLPACYVEGSITLDKRQYQTAIFISLEAFTMLIESESRDLEDCVEELLNELIEHELIHELIEWEHDFEVVDRLCRQNPASI